MHKYNVLTTNASCEYLTTTVEACSFTIENGILFLVGEEEDFVAVYSVGRWVECTRLEQ